MKLRSKSVFMPGARYTGAGLPRARGFWRNNSCFRPIRLRATAAGLSAGRAYGTPPITGSGREYQEGYQAGPVAIAGPSALPHSDQEPS